MDTVPTKKIETNNNGTNNDSVPSPKPSQFHFFESVGVRPLIVALADPGTIWTTGSTDSCLIVAIVVQLVKN